MKVTPRACESSAWPAAESGRGRATTSLCWPSP